MASTGAFSVVGIGASAGGLAAIRTLVKAIPAKPGMAFIVVQHLDPHHQSMMSDLLADDTSMPVLQAVDGARIEPDHVYLIPPGVYLSVADRALRITPPPVRHGARLPIDHLFHSLSDEFAERAIGVILTGTGADGSRGLKSIRERGGLVIAQDPDEAEFDGMPQSAILTGGVDLVLPVAKIPVEFLKYSRRLKLTSLPRPPDPSSEENAGLGKIIELLRAKTSHDFTHYKSGTLQRRTERRMALAGIATNDFTNYLELLGRDDKELGLLAKDLLINVTAFFRDAEVFETVQNLIVPELVREARTNRTLRVWIAGCSSGEEAFSLAMLLQEAIAAEKLTIKLQIFGSDVDPEAIAKARQGFYPASIETDVSPERLKRFFVKEEHGYRVTAGLREAVVFTVQDVMADPPFARLDMVSCRNFLIYLRPKAQVEAIDLFHFALKDKGVLLLGSSETAGNVEGRFTPIAKAERLYRRIGENRSGGHSPLGFAKRSERAVNRPDIAPELDRSRRALLAQRLVLQAYAPAVVLINRQYECLYYLGPTERYLKVASGEPVHDLLLMVHENVRTRVRSAVQQAFRDHKKIVVPGGPLARDGDAASFRIEIQPISSDDEELMLVCFVNEPSGFGRSGVRRGKAGLDAREASGNSALKGELEATKSELQTIIRELEHAEEQQRMFREEALSVSEEYQSTNEELLTSKEELQSLNEELTALNSQLQETLERQRTTANDLQNVLISTDVATLFLDMSLNIRFFTPATKLHFRLLPSDVGRPIADLNSLSVDERLAEDAATVLKTLHPAQREIEASTGRWYTRRTVPYRGEHDDVEGVVVTYNDVTERRAGEQSLMAARREADVANAEKSRFLAAASHDLRQPLQTMVFLPSSTVFTWGSVPTL